MRSIIQKKKTNRTKQLVLSIGLVLIMFISVLGYAFQGGDNSESDKKLIYNGFEFVNQNSFWFLEIGNFEFFFKYNPNQVERSDSKVNYLNSYSGKPLYIYSENIEAESEIYRNLFYENKIVQRMHTACLDEECDESSPVKTCSDNFILIIESNETMITQNISCVFIEGPQENLTKITDEFLFKILNID